MILPSLLAHSHREQPGLDQGGTWFKLARFDVRVGRAREINSPHARPHPIGGI